MARRRPYLELEADLARVSSERNALAYALSCVVRGDPVDAVVDWTVYEWRPDYERVSARLYGALAPHGGIVVRIVSVAGERDRVESERLDEWHARLIRSTTIPELLPERAACGELLAYRRERERWVSEQRKLDQRAP